TGRGVVPVERFQRDAGGFFRLGRHACRIDEFRWEFWCAEPFEVVFGRPVFPKRFARQILLLAFAGIADVTGRVKLAPGVVVRRRRHASSGRRPVACPVWLLRGPGAVDRDGGAGDLIGCRRAEKRDRAAQLLWRYEGSGGLFLAQKLRRGILLAD